MSSIMIEVPPDAMQPMARSIDRLYREIGMSPSAAIEKAYRTFAASAAKRSPGNRRGPHPKTAKYRDVIPNPEYPLVGRSKTPRADDPVVKGKAKFLIVVKHQNKPDTFIPTNKRTGRGKPGAGDPRRKIGTRHLLLRSWKAAVAVGLGKGNRPDMPGRVSLRKLMRGRRELGRKVWNPFVELLHMSVYQLTVAPRIGTDAMKAASRGLDWQIRHRMIKGINTAWEE